MKITTTYFLALLTALCLSSCLTPDEPLPENPLEENELIFGTFFGECVGELCVTIYKLTSEGLYEDQNDHYPTAMNTANQFDFVRLSNEKFELVKEFINQIPAELCNENSSIIGCPDCYDQGGIYVQLSCGSWSIDVAKVDIPSYLHDFIDQLVANVALIRE